MTRQLTDKQKATILKLAQQLWDARTAILTFQHKELGFLGYESEIMDKVRSHLAQATGQLEGLTDGKVSTERK